MERFYNDHNGNKDDNQNDPSFFGDDFDDDEIMDAEVVGYINQQGMIDVMHMDLAQTELNQELLDKSVDISKGSWFWMFMTTEDRLDDIERIYRRLLKMTDENSEPHHE